MGFAVFLTKDATSDLKELYDYISINDSPRKAEYVLHQIEKNFSSLSEFPERGACPKELLKLGIRDYREFFSNHTASFTRSLTIRYMFCLWQMVAVICNRFY